MAAAELIRGGDPSSPRFPCRSTCRTSPTSPADIARLDRDGQLPGNVRVTEEDRLTPLAYLQVTMTDKPEVLEAPRTCWLLWMSWARASLRVRWSATRNVSMSPRPPSVRSSHSPLGGPASF